MFVSEVAALSFLLEWGIRSGHLPGSVGRASTGGAAQSVPCGLWFGLACSLICLRWL